MLEHANHRDRCALACKGSCACAAENEGAAIFLNEMNVAEGLS